MKLNSIKLYLIFLLFITIPTAAYAQQSGEYRHEPDRPLKVILVTGWQMGGCITLGNAADNDALLACAEEAHEPWTEWGNFEQAWLNPDESDIFYEKFALLVEKGLSEEDFLYYSYSGEWDQIENCDTGQQVIDNKCFNFKRPRYTKGDTDVAYVGISGTDTYQRRAGYMQRMIDAYPSYEFMIVSHSLGGYVSTFYAGSADANSLNRINAVVTLDSPLQGKINPLRATGWDWTQGVSWDVGLLGLSDEEVLEVIRNAPRQVPLYTFRHNDDQFVQPEYATLDGVWTDTMVFFPDDSQLSHSGVKENTEIVARYINWVMASGAIRFPNVRKPDYVGNYLQPNSSVKSILISKPTFSPGNQTPNIDYSIMINGVDTNISDLRYQSIIPYVSIDIDPPPQTSSGCYDLVVQIEGAHIDSYDLNSSSICYTGDDSSGLVDVALVVDRSCSMGCQDALRNFDPNKIIQAKKSAKLFVDTLDDGDYVSIVPFNENVSIQNLFPLTEINSQSKQLAKDNIDRIGPDGGTSIAQGIVSALVQLNQSPSQGHVQAIVLLTDGKEDPGEEGLTWLDAKDEIISSDIPIYTIGLGDQNNPNDLGENLLREIAQSTDGQYFFAPSANELRAIYDFIAGAVSNRQTIFQDADNIPAGTSREEIISIDSTTTEARFVLTWNSNARSLELELTTPSGTIINPQNVTEFNGEFLQDSGYLLYKIQSPESGDWKLSIRDVSIIAAHVANDGGDYDIGVTVKSDLVVDMTVGDSLSSQVYRAYDPVPVLVAINNVESLNISSVSGVMTSPSGRIKEFRLYDDGKHGDGMADDGTFGFIIEDAGETGSHSFVVEVVGADTSGQRFTRLARSSIVLDENRRPPADIAAMIVSVAGTDTNAPDYCLSYANMGPVDANAVALFADAEVGDLIDTTATATSGLMNHNLGWFLGDLPTDTSVNVKIQSTASRDPSSRLPAAAIGSDMDIANGVQLEETTTDRNYINNFAFSDNEYDLALSQGWNLIALPREMNIPLPENVLCTLQGEVEVILGFNGEGETYDPKLPEFSTLEEFDKLSAYWVKTTQPSTLRINGDNIYAGSFIHLKKGWNLVPYLPDSPLNLESALESVYDQVEAVLGFDQAALSHYKDIHKRSPPGFDRRF